MVILGTGFYTGFYTGRVWIFLIKPGPDPDPFRVFFLNPYPTLFLIGPGKTRPIRVGPDRVPADRVKIAIPNPLTWKLYTNEVAIRIDLVLGLSWYLLRR